MVDQQNGKKKNALGIHRPNSLASSMRSSADGPVVLPLFPSPEDPWFPSDNGEPRLLSIRSPIGLGPLASARSLNEHRSFFSRKEMPLTQGPRAQRQTSADTERTWRCCPKIRELSKETLRNWFESGIPRNRVGCQQPNLKTTL